VSGIKFAAMLLWLKEFVRPIGAWWAIMSGAVSIPFMFLAIFNVSRQDFIRCSSVRFALGAGSQSVQASIRANEVQAGSFARLQNYTRRPQFGSHRTRVDELEYATGRTA
jgi:hypothetical protein